MDHKVAMIVGGSSGIGRACVQRLGAVGGYRIYTASRSRPELLDPAAVHITMDVRCAQSVTAGVNQILEQCGRIDVLIYCAGYALAGPIEETTILEAQQLFETNFWGAVRVNNALLPSMRAAGRGSMVMIGSLAGVIPLPYQAYYSASKFAMEAYAEALRFELDPHGIAVHLVQPGDLKTSFTSNRKIAGQCSDQSPYWPSFQRCLQRSTQFEAVGGSADHVARRVMKILAQRKPTLRHRVTKSHEEALLWLRALGLRRLYERVIRRAFGL